jgi:hypothetical protein
LLESLIEYGYAKDKRIKASGGPKIEVIFRFAWDNLVEALSNPGSEGEFKVIADALRTIG